MSKQIPGQLSLFEGCTVIWKRYIGCTRGYCSICGSEEFYSGSFMCLHGKFEPNNPDDWESGKPGVCGSCGAVFTETTPPNNLPVLSGLTDEPIRRNNQ